MTQRESRISKAVIDRIRELGGHAVKTHPAGGTAGTPDVLGTLDGRALALEVKLPHTRTNTSARQDHQLHRWERSGAIAGVVCSADEAQHLIDQQTTTLTPQSAIEAIEAAMQAGEEEHGDRWRTRTVLHHMKKGSGHALAAGPAGVAVDEDSGHPHLVLAAARFALAVAVLLDGQADRQDAS